MLMKCLRVRQFAGWELHRGCQLVLVTHDTGSDNRVKLERKHRAQGYPSSQLCPLQSIESCKNPKGRLGVLTVWEESNVPAVAHSLQAREGIWHLKALTGWSALLMNQTCKLLDIQDRPSADACITG